MPEENVKTIEPVGDDLGAVQLQVCYLEGVVSGTEFISAGKCFWITDDPEKEDASHVYSGHLFKDRRS